MTGDESSKGSAFRRLHQREGAFVIPNPWDRGTARILASMGFKALATTSAGMAFSLGLKEGQASREQVLLHCREIVGATDLPVSADATSLVLISKFAVSAWIRVSPKPTMVSGRRAMTRTVTGSPPMDS